MLKDGAQDITIFDNVRGVTHLVQNSQRAIARRTSACSRAATELLGHTFHTKLQHNLVALQLKKSPLQLLDHVLQPLEFVVMPIHLSPQDREPLGDTLVDHKQLRVKPFILEVDVIKALLPPEHESLRPAKVILVHG